MWSYWVSVWVANAAIAIGLMGYIAIFFPALNHTPGIPGLVALSMIWVFVLINLLGARAAGWVQILTTALKLVPQFAVILLGLWLLLAHPAIYAAHVPSNPPSWREVNSVSTLALFAMLGIECAMIPASRVRERERTIPRATLTGTLIAALIYIAISAVPMFVIPQQELAASNAPFAAATSPSVAVFSHAGYPRTGSSAAAAPDASARADAAAHDVKQTSVRISSDSF